MSILHEFRRDEQSVIDRLVDGELSADERRELLSSLDDEPGAWRRCAVAFLEAQTWRWQLSRLASEPIVAQTTSIPLAVRPAERPMSTHRSLWGMALAVAASLLIAFGLGTRYPTADSWQTLATAPDADRGTDNQQTVAAENDIEREPLVEEGTVTFALTGGNEEDQQITLPVTSMAAGDQDWMVDDPSAVSSQLLQRLQQAGLEVTWQQRLFPVELSDGRQLIVPIEEMEIHDPELAQYQ